MSIGKKGDLTSTQIIFIVLAIIGFGIVLLVLLLIDFGGYSERDICKLSVLSRATAPSAVQGAVPLKCRTEKICLSDGSGKCKEQFAGEENVIDVRLSGTPSQQARQIEEVSAIAMYDCWTMMGEGKLDLFGSFFGDDVLATCVVCSRVAIDKGVSPDVLKLVNVDNYLKNAQVPGSSLTYLQTFTDKSVTSYQTPLSDADVAKMGGTITGTKEFSGQYYDMAYVFSQIRSKDVVNVLINMGAIGGTVGAATFMTPILGTVAKKLILTPVGLVVAGVVAGGAAIYGAERVIAGQKAAAVYCGKYARGQEQSKTPGCSVVQAVPYSFSDVNAICGKIQGEL